jgi:phosphate/sulfate permease
LILTAVAEFSGPFLFRIAGAKTIGSETIPPNLMTLPVLLAALTGAIQWNLITWYFGIPNSFPHTLIGGLIGTVIAGLGATAIAIGTFSGGWSLIKTLGAKFFRIRPVHGFCTQDASAAVILGAALLGGPVSTTQVVSSTIMGVGSSERINKVG